MLLIIIDRIIFLNDARDWMFNIMYFLIKLQSYADLLQHPRPRPECTSILNSYIFHLYTDFYFSSTSAHFHHILIFSSHTDY